MTVFIATLIVKEGKEEEFEKLQTELSELTHEQEPDCHVYDVMKHTEKPGTYVVYGRFKDEEAFNYHQRTEPHERLVPPILDCLAEEMQIDFYEWVA